MIFLEWPKIIVITARTTKMLTTEECAEMNLGTGKFSDDVEMTVE